jgi:NitT/TauT family transport system substrate-binding protein
MARGGARRRAGAAAAAAFAGALAAGPADAADALSFATNWVAQGEHGGYYQALTEGIYERYGIALTLRPGGPQINTAQLLAAGALDFAIVSNSFVPLNLLKEGAPYVAVAALFQKDPQILIAHKEMGFTSLADLKGRPIQISTGAADGYWRWLAVRFGFTDDQIRPYTYNIAPFLVDKTLIQQEYVTNYRYEVKTAGFDPQVFLLADYGYSSYSAILMTSKKRIAEQPAQVQRFVDATVKGWHAYLHGPHDKAIARILKDNPDYTAEWAESATQALRDNGIVESGDTAALGIGAMTDARWKDFFDTMVQAGLYKPDFDYRAAYTLQFIGRKVEAQ